MAKQDASISFELATGELYRVDIDEKGEAVPKYRRLEKVEGERLREFLATLPPEGKLRECISTICNIINRVDRYATRDVKAYVSRVVDGMSEDELSAMETAVYTYAKKITDKLDALETVYREKQFYQWLDSGKIVCRPVYALPEEITATDATDAIPKSLYRAERSNMNAFEHWVLDAVVSMDNVKWWHRIIDRQGFQINGFINHYPDFMVMTHSGVLVLIEAKGDYLDGDDSKSKLKLGRKWQALAGEHYRYFMVFDDKDIGMDGAYTLDRFVAVMQDL